MQTIISGSNNFENIILLHNIKKPFVVHTEQFSTLGISGIIEKLHVSLIEYSDFSVNPQYEEICKAVKIFKDLECDSIIAIGGGSAIDFAKCIKLFSCINENDYLIQKNYIDSGMLLIAVPSTAGTGSESTHFAVVYKNNEKHSVAHSSILPDYAVLLPEILNSLPLYQKKCTFLDALCQSIESWWSIKSNTESISYSKKSIEILLNNYSKYFNSDNSVNHNMLIGANYSGKAINITQTTAPHALSYKLTSMFNLPHGHAVAICLPVVWQFMLDNPDITIDIRGTDYVNNTFKEIASLLGYNNPVNAISGLMELLKNLNITSPVNISDDVIISLSESVNTERLNNSPVSFDKNMIYNIYSNILK